MTALNESVFAAIWRDHADAVQAYLRRRVGDPAEDLTQDVFLRAWAKRDQYDPDRGPVVGWLFGIAAHLVADYLRANGRSPEVSFDIDDRAADTCAPDVANAAVDRVTVATALATLPEHQQAVLAHRYLADRSVTDTASALGVAAGTVKSACARALAALRVALGVIAPTSPRRPKPPRLADVTPAPESARSTTVAAPRHRRADRARGHLHRHRPARHRAARRGTTHPPGVPHPGDPRLAHVARAGTAPAAGRAGVLAAARRSRRPGHRADRGVALELSHRSAGGDSLMFSNHPIPGWVLTGGFLAFDMGIVAFIALMLGEIGKTTRWRTPRWWLSLWRVMFGRGRHKRGWIGPIRQRVVFAAGRSTVATPTTFLPRFIPEPVEPGSNSPLGGEVEGTDPESTDEPDPLLDEGAYHTGMTFAFPKAAAIIHEARAKAAAR